MCAQASFDIVGVNQGSCAVHIGGPTTLELALYAMLDDLGILYQPEYNVGPYRIDAFAAGVVGGWTGPGLVKGDPKGPRIGFEADGPLHFTPAGKRRDHIRDEYILATGKVDAMVRLDSRQLAQWR
jgi:hypothetical protein